MTNLTYDDIIKCHKLLKELIPDCFPTMLIPLGEAHWRKHYPEYFTDEDKK